MFGSVIAPPPAGAVSPLNPRGAWAASTVYATRDVVSYQGSSYVAIAGFTSGSTFDATKWTLLAAKGVDGLAGGGINGVSLSNDGQLVRNAQPSVQWTSPPKYDTTNQSYGSACLSGGVGSLPFTITPSTDNPPTFLCMLFSIRSTTASFTGNGDFIKVTDSAGQVWGVRRTGTTLSLNYNGVITDLGYVVTTGVKHWFKWVIVATGGGVNYQGAYLDDTGSSGNQNNGASTYLRQGAAVFSIDVDNNLAAGDTIDEYIAQTTDYNGIPTAEISPTAATLILLHFNSDAINYASPPVTTPITYSPDNDTIVPNPSKALAAPMLRRIVPILTLPKDGSAFDGQINAFIRDTKAAGYSMGELKAGWAKVYDSIVIPDNFDLVGRGRHDDSGSGYWNCGVKLEGGFNLGKPVVSMVGVGNNQGTTQGYVVGPGLHSVCVTGTLSMDKAMSGYQPALIEAANVYHLRMSYISGGNDYFCCFRAKSVWDSDVNEMKFNSGGFSDPTADPAAASVLAYTGRSSAIGAELALPRYNANGTLSGATGRSLGVPMVDYWSDDPNGQAVTNNLRTYSMHLESNSGNGVPLMVHGPNTGSTTFLGCKIECAEGQVPQIVLDSAHGFFYQGWLYGAATGYPYGAIGGVPSGTGWATYKPSAALVLAADSFNPHILASGGYANGGNAGQPDSLFTFIRCSNPKVDFGTEDGLNRVTIAKTILNNCQNVSPYAIRAPAASYVPGATLQALSVINGTTLDPTLRTFTVNGVQMVAIPWT